jgi:hypothetical protein
MWSVIHWFLRDVELLTVQYNISSLFLDWDEAHAFVAVIASNGRIILFSEKYHLLLARGRCIFCSGLI